MGEAKRRGSQELRIKEGIQKEAKRQEEREKAYQEYLNSRTPAQKRKARELSILTAFALGASL